jgi:hypothetical protein
MSLEREHDFEIVPRPGIAWIEPHGPPQKLDRLWLSSHLVIWSLFG